MTEITEAPVRTAKPRTKIILIVLSILILFLVYGAGIIVAPISILTKVQGKDCDSVLSLNKAYIALYPKFMQDQTLSAPVNECKAHVLAGSNEANGNWRDA
jgi:hypothetical protein